MDSVEDNGLCGVQGGPFVVEVAHVLEVVLGMEELGFGRTGGLPTSSNNVKEEEESEKQYTEDFDEFGVDPQLTGAP